MAWDAECSPEDLYESQVLWEAEEWTDFSVAMLLWLVEKKNLDVGYLVN